MEEAGFTPDTQYRGGTPKGFTQVTTFDRRRRVAELLAKRAMTGKEISEELGITESTASRDIAAVKKIWRAAIIEDVDAMMSRDLAELGMIQREAWWLYQQSIEAGDVTETDADVLTRSGDIVNLHTRVEQNPKGSLAALKMVQSCIEKKRKILGLDKEVGGAGSGKLISFTVKIGDRVLESEASTVSGDDILDAEMVELDSTGKALPSGTEDG